MRNIACKNRDISLGIRPMQRMTYYCRWSDLIRAITTLATCPPRHSSYY